MYKTDSGTWILVNYTRYNTQELLDIANRIEAELKRIGLKPDKNGRNYWEPSEDRTFLYIDTYQPTSKASSTYAEDIANFYVKAYNARKDEVRIVPPDKLGLSALEELSQARNEQGVRTPDEFLVSVIEGLCMHYTGVVFHPAHARSGHWLLHDVVEAVIKKNPTLHYTFKAENRKASKYSKDVRFQQLSSHAAGQAGLVTYQTVKPMLNLKVAVDKLNNYAKQRGLPSYIDSERVTRISAEVESLRLELEQLEKSLRVE